MFSSNIIHHFLGDIGSWIEHIPGIFRDNEVQPLLTSIEYLGQSTEIGGFKYLFCLCTFKVAYSHFKLRIEVWDR